MLVNSSLLLCYFVLLFVGNWRICMFRINFCGARINVARINITRLPKCKQADVYTRCDVEKSKIIKRWHYTSIASPSYDAVKPAMLWLRHGGSIFRSIESTSQAITSRGLTAGCLGNRPSCCTCCHWRSTV